MVTFFSNLFKADTKAVENYIQMLLSMLSGSATTLSIFILTLLFAVPFAMLVALGRMSKNKILSGSVNVFLLIIRGTPLMLQLLIVYFVPKLFAVKVFGTTIRWSSYIAAIVAFSINYAAYFAEIYRGGIEAIPKGQYEACQVLGYNKSQTFFKIILPQVVKRIIPAMGNEVITLVKDTSLVTILSIQELMYFAKSSSNRMVSFTPLLIAGIFYFVMNWLVAFIFRKLEKRFSYYS
ncbi:MAG: amino acid ABC transporter permease [Treponema sp.]|nr:amino acid ABC transporter permease [Treponema sp.]